MSRKTGIFQNPTVRGLIMGAIGGITAAVIAGVAGDGKIRLPMALGIGIVVFFMTRRAAKLQLAQQNQDEKPDSER